MRGRERLLLSFSALAILALISINCSGKTQYSILNFFFDGVPSPDGQQKREKGAPTQTARAGQQQKKKGELPPETPRYKHPAAEGKDDCSFCHGKVTRLVLPPKDMCLRCHEHLKDNRPFMHGPAVVDCIVCHNVHDGETKALVRKIGNPLCYDCHDRGGLQEGLQEGTPRAEAHSKLNDGNVACLFCHDPNGGKDRFFLKEQGRNPSSG